MGLLLLMLFSQYTIPFHTTASAPACGAYLHYRTITVPAQSSLSADLTNYPVLVSGTYAYLATVANGGKVSNASGYDVGFFTDNTCTSKLPWETETWTAASGLVNYWVQVPTLSHTTSTTFIMAYDNPGVSTDQSNATGTWDSSFYGVYHLAEVSFTTGGADSTSHANAVVPASGTPPSAVAGQIDGAASFPNVGGGPGGDLHDATASGMPVGNAPRTMSGWMFATTLAGGAPVIAVTGTGTATAGPVQYFLYTSGTNLSSVFGSGLGLTTGSTTLSTSTWYYVAATYDGSSNKVYVNGTLDGSLSYSSAAASGTVLQIGNWGGSQQFVGTLDEMRYSSTARSADWLKTDYLSQSSPATFYSVSTEH